MGRLLDEGLRQLGFKPTNSTIAGQPKTFWFLGDYVFSDRGISSYGQGGGREVRFHTRRRKTELVDAEILEKLTKHIRKEDPS